MINTVVAQILCGNISSEFSRNKILGSRLAYLEAGAA